MTNTQLPYIYNTPIYQIDKYKITKLWKWDGDVYYDSRIGIACKYIDDEHKKCILATSDGAKVIPEPFDDFRVCGNKFDVEWLTRYGVGLVNEFTYPDYTDCIYAAVYMEGQGWGLIDKDLNIVVPLKYEDADYENGIIKVKQNGEWYCVNEIGEAVKKINFIGGKRYDIVLGNGNNRNIVGIKSKNVAHCAKQKDEEYLFGVVDDSGNEIVPVIYNQIAISKDGLLAVELADVEFSEPIGCQKPSGMFDRDGNVIIPIEYLEFRPLTHSENLIYASHYQNGKYGAIFDERGNIILEPGKYGVHGTLFPFNPDVIEGRLIIYKTFTAKKPDENGEFKSYNLYGVYDVNKRKILFEPQFERVYLLHDGYVAVKDSDAESCDIRVLDCDGNVKCVLPYESIRLLYPSGYQIYKGGNVGALDKDFNVVFPCEYRDDSHGNIVDENRMRYIKGKTYFELHPELKEKYFSPQVDEDTIYMREMLAHSVEGKYGVARPNGSDVIPPVYRDIYAQFIGDICFYVAMDGSDKKDSLIGSDGEVILTVDDAKIWLCLDDHISIKNYWADNKWMELYKVTSM